MVVFGVAATGARVGGGKSGGGTGSGREELAGEKKRLRPRGFGGMRGGAVTTLSGEIVAFLEALPAFRRKKRRMRE